MNRLQGVAAASVVVMASATPMTGFATPTGTASAERCRLVRLATPQGSPWGTVVDIDRVDGKPTYYGSLDKVRSDGTIVGRAAVWSGLEAKPRYVGPRGWPITTAFDLTRSGLVNGMSEDPETGKLRFWVQDLATGRLRFLSTSLEGVAAQDAWVRRINDEGRLVGALQPRNRENPVAVGYRSAVARPVALPVPRRARGAEASGINERGDRSGFWAEPSKVGGEVVPLFRPTVWRAGGGRVQLPTPGLDASARVVNDRRQAGGFGWWGDLAGGHNEAVAWPSYDRAVALGLLPGGGSSGIYGMDRGGRLVGGGDRFDPESPLAHPEEGIVQHSFFWKRWMGPGRVRVLPSLHAVRTGEKNWREWHATHIAHASHHGLDEIGGGTHTGFDAKGEPIGAPTVFRNASRCGVLVRTTHRAFWESGEQQSRRGRTGAAPGLRPTPADELRRH